MNILFPWNNHLILHVKLKTRQQIGDSFSLVRFAHTHFIAQLLGISSYSHTWVPQTLRYPSRARLPRELGQL